MQDTAVSEVWCSKCEAPADSERDGVAYCGRHDPTPLEPRYVPDAITDPWLRRQYAQATGAVDLAPSAPLIWDERRGFVPAPGA